MPTLFVLVTLSFFIIRLAPGGPFDQEQALPPAIRANLDAAYGLDQPLLVQYGRYLAGVAQGDLGPSFRYKDFRVTELIAQRPAAQPNYRPRGGGAGASSSACRWARAPRGAPTRSRDHALMGFSMLGVVLPGFVVGPLLALVFGIYWPIFRVAGYEPGDPSFLVLPVVTLALPVAAYIARLTRSSMQEVLRVELHPHGARQGNAPRASCCCATRCGRRSFPS